MTYVYLLSFYGEHGSEEVKATLDRNRLHAMIDSYYDDPANEKVNCRQQNHAALDEQLVDSEETLAAPDAAISPGGAWPRNLSDGWGGMQLHVVKLE